MQNRDEQSNLDSNEQVGDKKDTTITENKSDEEVGRSDKIDESEATANMHSSHNTVLVKGEVHQVKKGLGQDQKAAENFEKVKDFFKSQEHSSIVEVPNSVKREEDARLFKNSFVPILTDYDVDDVSKEEGKFCSYK